MVFKCQEDSFLKEFVSNVVSCEKAEYEIVQQGKKVKKNGYEVILEDTILFPEGGGQPADHGFLNDTPVDHVLRREDKAIHLVENPLNVGDSVKQVVDWKRRFDHMQHHSGQHLITAILEREYKFPTVSWWLGEDISHVELDTPSITPEQIKNAEDIINELIRENKKVTVRVFGEDTPEEVLQEARSARGLPADHKGDIRVIDIEDVDSSMCCGTHITNLSQLQVIKLLHSEKSKRKDKTLLYFLVGNRVLDRLSGCIEREQQLTGLLKSNPVKHVELVDKLQKNVKSLTKNLQGILKDVASIQAKQLNELTPTPSYFFYHRTGAEPDFMNTFIRELGRTDIFLMLSVGDEKTEGNILLYGDEKVIAELRDKIAEALGGKGAGKGNRYQAKVTKMANRTKAQDIVIEYFKTNSIE